MDALATLFCYQNLACLVFIVTLAFYCVKKRRNKKQPAPGIGTLQIWQHRGKGAKEEQETCTIHWSAAEEGYVVIFYRDGKKYEFKEGEPASFSAQQVMSQIAALHANGYVLLDAPFYAKQYQLEQYLSNVE